MHYDPLISSRSERLFSWGHDWVVLCLIVAKPFWAPTKVFALPVAMRLYRNRQGLTKGKKSHGKISKAKPEPWLKPRSRLRGEPPSHGTCRRGELQHRRFAIQIHSGQSLFNNPRRLMQLIHEFRRSY